MIQQLLRNIPPVTKNLLIINVLMFLATLVFQFQNVNLVGLLGMYYPLSPFFEPYQIATHMFMHGGIGHIFFNMFFGLFMFGSLIERTWGPKRFLFYYLATGLGAVALHLGVTHLEASSILNLLEENGISYVIREGASGWETALEGVKTQNFTAEFERLNAMIATPTVGASGAIYGLLLAFGMMFPNKELMLLFIPVPIKAKYFIPGLMLLELYLGVANFEIDNIAHFAHLGGALFGFLMLLYWKKTKGSYF